MKVEKNKMVSVIYELKLNDKNGKTVEIASKESPLEFIYGNELLLPAFENELTDKKVGDKFEISITSNEGYGPVNDYMVVNIPKSVFEINGQFDSQMVAEGNRLPMMTQDGNMLDGLVKEISNDIVTMDFNHPLAGKDLYFEGEIIAIRDATEDELNSEYEGCNDEGCDDECCDDECCED